LGFAGAGGVGEEERIDLDGLGDVVWEFIKTEWGKRLRKEWIQEAREKLMATTRRFRKVGDQIIDGGEQGEA
jgi:hypothetical protein